MPVGSPFTHLCRQLARPCLEGRADLHLHTTFSDGSYTPVQVVDLARRSGLDAIAITDHDTLAGIAPARAAALPALEVISGVEITSEFQGKELHLLGYFVDTGNEPLREALAEICQGRQERFHAMLGRLEKQGVKINPSQVEALKEHGALGRRHLAEMLVRAGHAATLQQAFVRYLGDRGPVQVAKRRLPVGRSIQLVRAAGGVAAWAHPVYDDARAHLKTLKDLGLGALEVYFPSCRPGHVRELRQFAEGLGLAVTGGSDCHGPEPLRQAVGSFGVGTEDLERLRSRTMAQASGGR